MSQTGNYYLNNDCLDRETSNDHEKIYCGSFSENYYVKTKYYSRKWHDEIEPGEENNYLFNWFKTEYIKISLCDDHYLQNQENYKSNSFYVCKLSDDTYLIGFDEKSSDIVKKSDLYGYFETYHKPLCAYVKLF